MTGSKEELIEYRDLKNGGLVKFGNNALGEIKGYGMTSVGTTQLDKCFTVCCWYRIKGLV